MSKIGYYLTIIFLSIGISLNARIYHGVFRDVDYRFDVYDPSQSDMYPIIVKGDSVVVMELYPYIMIDSPLFGEKLKKFNGKETITLFHYDVVVDEQFAKDALIFQDEWHKYFRKHSILNSEETEELLSRDLSVRVNDKENCRGFWEWADVTRGNATFELINFENPYGYVVNWTSQNIPGKLSPRFRYMNSSKKEIEKVVFNIAFLNEKGKYMFSNSHDLIFSFECRGPVSPGESLVCSWDEVPFSYSFDEKICGVKIDSIRVYFSDGTDEILKGRYIHFARNYEKSPYI